MRRPLSVPRLVRDDPVVSVSGSHDARHGIPTTGVNSSDRLGGGGTLLRRQRGLEGVPKIAGKVLTPYRDGFLLI